MAETIALVALVVREYDEAIAFFRDCLGFVVKEDTRLSESKRWVVVGPPDGRGADLLLARAVTAEQSARIGDQAGGRVFLFLHTDDFRREYDEMCSRGVKFIEGPRDEDYGTVAVFLDICGNRWDLIQPRV